MQFLQPEGWPRPRGYSNGILAEGRLIFVAGQVGWNAGERFESTDLVEQTLQALENVLAVLREGGAGAEHVTRLRWYVTDMAEYRRRRPEIGRVYRSVFGRHYPAMSCLEVSALADEGARVEIEATAVLPTIR